MSDTMPGGALYRVLHHDAPSGEFGADPVSLPIVAGLPGGVAGRHQPFNLGGVLVTLIAAGLGIRGILRAIGVM